MKKHYQGLKVEPAKYQISNCVPYQKCPVCEGSGLDNRFVTATSTFGSKCDVCDGEKIIPMHVLKDEIKIVKNKSITCFKRCGNTIPSNNEDNICLNCGSSIISLL